MSRLQDLIDELCPDGVEYKTLGEVCTFNRGQTITKKNSIEGPIPVVSGGTEPAYYVSENNRTGETVTVAGSGAGAGFVSYWNEPIWCGDSFSVDVKEGISITPRFLYAYLKANENYIRNKKQGAGVPHVHGKQLKNMRIPVPPLPVQEEIVRILDSFSSLEAELEAELEARRKQYAHYRDELFKFERERVEYKTLGELCTNLDSRRKPVTKSSREPGPYPYYGASGIVDYVSGYLFDGEFLLVTEDGANPVARSTPIAFVATGKIWVNNHAHILEFSDKTTQAYVEMYLNSIDLTEFITGAVQPKLSQKNLNRIPIPVPVGKDMTVMVERLKLIQELANDLSSGLPAEIEARHKQYEYYRDRLLTFPEKEV